jgi:ABC-type transport system involved in multi-copper enzyme maturation permease subunit
LSCLLVIAVLLPIALSVTWGVSQLLAAMQDASWAAIVQRTGLVIAVVWVIDLICLLLALAINALAADTSSDESTES